jgi:sulfofructose kinase
LSNNHPPLVAGVGQCSLDILGRLPRYPAVDRKAELSELLLQGGGPVATALVTLARLGVPAAFVGKVGGDDFGRRIRRELEQEGVDCRYLVVDETGTSQIAFISVEQNSGLRNIFWHAGSARDLTAADLPLGLIARCRVLHLDGLQHAASMAAAKEARRCGVITVLDGGSVREGTLELLPYIDHLVVSSRFARQLSGDRTPEKQLPELMAYGARAATITVGKKGSYTFSREEGLFHRPAFAVQAVDTTGCGDVFHGGYIYGLLQNWPLTRTVRFAAACAALKTRALGGRTAIPGADEVARFLLSREDAFARKQAE